MICADISNVWGQIALPDLLTMESEVASAHERLMEGTGENRGWLELPERMTGEVTGRILTAARRIREDSDACVIVGVSDSCLGARGAIELLQGTGRNIGKGRGDPQIFFAGNSFSTRHWQELSGLLKDKDFSVIAVSGSGITAECAIALRSLRWMLERKYGTEAARRRIYAVTDPAGGALRQMAEEEGWESFDIPADVAEGYCVLSPAGLLPMAVAGIDIEAVLEGAGEAKACYNLRSYENPLWLYAAVRNLLYRGGKAVELFASFEPDFRAFGLWWQQLFGRSEGKDGKGLFPATAELPGDLHALGQMILEGQRNLFETVVRFAPPENGVTVGADWRNLDGLNCLEGKTLDFVEENACSCMIEAQVDSGVPVITVDCGSVCEQTVGELFYFLELCCGVSAYLLGVDPFCQPGVEVYRGNLMRLLGKTDCSCSVKKEL